MQDLMPAATSTAEDASAETARSIRGIWPHDASVGLILGTGSAAVANAFGPECELAFGELPHLVPPTAVGHPGRFIGARLADVPVAILQGRVHLYEGHTREHVQLPVHVLAALGVRTLIVTNASGGLNPSYRCGDLVVVEDLVDLTFTADDAECSDRAFPARTVRRSNPFATELVATAWTQGRRAGFRIHRGTYAGVLGPNYETRAEYRFLHRVADVVGMSTVHEVAAARRLGMRVLALSVVSNECCPDRLTKTTGESVVRAVEQAADRLAHLITHTCRAL
jgi:purine-nucleoside phosphorylase